MGVTMNIKLGLSALAISAALVGSSASAANMLVNGGFEASSSQTTTPPGWTNIGHTDGVISYANFGTPAYEGRNYYDIGGFGSPTPGVGDGITQTVATAIGQAYQLTFGYTGENTAGVTTVLDVLVGAQTFHFTINADNSGLFLKPFVTTTIDYVATAALTAISFKIGSSTQIGYNDPLIDGVSFDVAKGGGGGVPEPATWAMMILGFGAVGTMLRTQRRRIAA
jgi:hypothetical protein